MKKNPVYIVDDDPDDIDMISEACQRLNISRQVKFFRTGSELLAHFKDTDVSPYFILCDVNLPGETGFDIKKRLSIDDQMKYRSVPFIFWSNNASQKQVQFAYDLPAQGFFIKPDSLTELCDTFKTILDYWQKSQHPKPIT